MKAPLAVFAAGLYVVSSLVGCSVLMAMNGQQQPDFNAFEIGSSRQAVELQLGSPVASQSFGDGRKKDTYRFEMGNSPNGHRALMNLYIDLATFGLWEIPGSIIEGMMGHKEETSVTYDAKDRVLAIEGYAPPPPSQAEKDSIKAHEKPAQPTPEQKKEGAQ